MAEPLLFRHLNHFDQFLTNDTQVVFITDGEFNEGKNAYGIAQLPNVTKFIMIFPTHTPYNAEKDHYAYLPKITPVNIPIISERTNDIENLLNMHITNSIANRSNIFHFNCRRIRYFE